MTYTKRKTMQNSSQNKHPDIHGKTLDPSKSLQTRKKFLKLMGAATVMLTAACRRPTERIIPAVIRAPETSPGINNYYSTMSPDGVPMVIKSRDGRPLKIAGNPDFPLCSGSVSAYRVADLMDLYDPDRIQKPISRNVSGKKVQLDTEKVIQKLKARLTKGNYAIVSSGNLSPTSKIIFDRFLQQNPGGQHLVFHPNPLYRQIQSAQQVCYSNNIGIPLYRFDKAKVIVSIDGDFLGTLPGNEYYSHLFGKGRFLSGVDKSPTMSRFFAFESMMTVTGSNADHRYPILPNTQLLVVLALLAYLQRTKPLNLPADWQQILGAFTPEKIGNWIDKKITDASIFEAKRFTTIIELIGKQLWKNRGQSLIFGGGITHENGQVEAFQIAVNLLNSALGNDGKTVEYQHQFGKDANTGALTKIVDFQQLADQLNSNAIENLICVDTNLVYHSPKGIDLAAAIRKTPYVLAISHSLDETASLAHDVIPLSHYLEAWNYYQPLTDVHCVAQPLIRPLYDSINPEDFLLKASQKPLTTSSNYYEFLRTWLKGNVLGLQTTNTLTFEKRWAKVLKKGFFLGNSNILKNNSAPTRNLNYVAMLSQLKKSLPDAGSKILLNKDTSFIVGIYSNVQVREGDRPNNTLRQELPEPITKIVWDNYAALLPETARKLNIKQGDLLQIQLSENPNSKITIAAHLQPGLHPKVLMIAQGYGRKNSGEIANQVGKSVQPLCCLKDKTNFLQTTHVVNLKNTGDTYMLASTQAIYDNRKNKEAKAAFTPKELLSANYNGSSQYDRPLVRETVFKDYATGDFSLSPEAVEYPKNQELVPSWKYDKHRWHMIIDLNSCTGCGACVTSCNTENNIPMVGKEQVSYGREMHWIRIDRYFSGNEGEPALSNQPMLCQHCENAPCENVCPVVATTHNSEGLNTMAYNRCIGTRYCANNCPYKVRRFNYYEYWNFWEGFTRKIRSPQHLGLNPNVTVRSRGVIEKCTFCIQRINAARQEVRNQGGENIPDQTIKTACQEVCPTNAIQFGNILDQDSTINKELKNQKKRSYQVLDYLNVKPSIHYLAKVRNQVK